jgi:hypothetical protein
MKAPVTRPAAWGNLLSTVTVFLCLFGLIAMAPDAHKEETELRCDISGTAKAVFPSMNACVDESRRIGACACHRVENKWTSWYVFGVAPLLATVLAYFLLTGTLSIRLLLLNVAVADAILAQSIWSLFVDPAAVMIVPLIPAFVAGFCAGTSILFLVLHFAGIIVKRWTSAT